MSTKNKIFLIISLLFIFLNFSFANSFEFNNISKENISNEEAKQIAENYINNMYNGNIFGLWKNNNPQINGEGVYFYTDKESPSYIEYKISCDTEIDCGFVLVNLDRDDTKIPISSTTGKTISDLLGEKNNNKLTSSKKIKEINKNNNKYYYFGPAEQYVINESNGFISTINPSIDSFDNKTDLVYNNSTNNKKEFRDLEKMNVKLKERLDFLISNSKKIKSSKEFIEFRKKRKELEKQKIYEDGNSLKNISSDPEDYEQIGSGIYVVGNSAADCPSRIPCYNQFNNDWLRWGFWQDEKDYGETCFVGCTPIAVGMTFGYHDRKNKSNIFPNFTAPSCFDIEADSNTYPTCRDSNDNLYNLFKQLSFIRLSLKTECEPDLQGGTYMTDISPGILDFSKRKGYKNTTSELKKVDSKNINTRFTEMQYEIKRSRPILIGITGTLEHNIVGYGYNSGANTLRVNFGWGRDTLSNANIGIYTNTFEYSDGEQGHFFIDSFHTANIK